MLIRLPPVLSVTPFRPLLFIVFLELLVLSNLYPQIEEIGELTTLKMAADLEVKVVERNFCELSLGRQNETPIP